MHRLGSLGHLTGTSEPQPGEHGRATCRKWLMSKHSRGAATMWVFRARFRAHAIHGFTGSGKLITPEAMDSDLGGAAPAGREICSKSPTKECTRRATARARGLPGEEPAQNTRMLSTKKRNKKRRANRQEGCPRSRGGCASEHVSRAPSLLASRAPLTPQPPCRPPQVPRPLSQAPRRRRPRCRLRWPRPRP